MWMPVVRKHYDEDHDRGQRAGVFDDLRDAV